MVSDVPKTPTSVPIALVDPSQILVDAPTYQFRSHGDKNGVTKSHRFSEGRWDPMLHSDPLLLHQRLDGSLYVADGHHRLDLAKRSQAAGLGPEQVPALILREADGYTTEDVRVIAAYKNMAHGHTDVVDSARVFKEAESGRVHVELLPPLQMDKGNLRLSYRLSGLSDKALDKVAAKEVPAEMAAFVADRTKDPIRQESVINIISAKLKQEYYTGGGYENVSPPIWAQPPSPPSFAGRIRQQQAMSSGISLN